MQNSERVAKKTKTNNAEFVNDGLTTEEIRKNIKNIREYIANNKNATDVAEKLKKDYEFFSTRYPLLYSMACDEKKFDYDSLEYFLNMRDRIINEQISAEDASKKVGQDWFNKYVDLSKK